MHRLPQTPARLLILTALALGLGTVHAGAEPVPPTFLFHLNDETIHPDHVLQSNETAILSFSAQGLDDAMTSVDWSLTVDHPGVIVSALSGTIDTIPSGPDREVFLELTVEGGSFGALASATTMTLSLNGTDSQASYTADLSLSRAQVLLISDGMPLVREILGPDLERAGIVWGYAGVPIDQLPQDMYGAHVIMIEADGRYSDVLFTDDDGPVRDWFRFGYGGGSISGLYLNEIYPNADPSWLGGIGGEWPDATSDTLFEGIPDDAIADGRTVEALSPDGISICFPCCGNPANFYTTDGDAVAGWVDYGWRIVDYGFSLVHLENDDPFDLSRADLIDRTANWLLFQEASVINPLFGESSQAVDFELVRAYPNPFNARLTIDLGETGPVAPRVQILNTLGRVVHSVRPPVGDTRLTWDASHHPSGTYLLRVTAGDQVVQRKVTLVK